MDLDRITVNIRPRTPWEAVDLGFILARKWYWQLLALAATVTSLTLVCLFPVALLLPGSAPKWLFVLFWFCKPVYEPALLSWLSNGVFGDEKGTNETLLSLIKTLRFHYITLFFNCRFTLYRCFVLPIVQLENLRGKKRKQRLQILAGGSGIPVLLLIACFLAELVLMLSLVTLLFWLIPEELRRVDFDDFIFTPDKWILVISYFLSCTLLAPFFVSSGFMLYLSRRVELEAWDLEIGFKRLRKRLQNLKSAKNHFVSSIIVLLCSSIFFLHPLCLAAPPEPELAKQTIIEVLEQNDFGEKVTRTHWVLKKQEAKEINPTWDKLLQKLMEFIAGPLAKFQSFLATYGEVLIWCFMITLTAFLLLKYTKIRHWIGKYSPRITNDFTPASMVFGLDVRPKSLPKDLSTTCKTLLAEEKQREAISLLYRGTLSALINRHQLQIESSFTENECCTTVRSQRPENEYIFFQKLTYLWIYLAYGHQRFDNATCFALIDSYQHLFGDRV